MEQKELEHSRSLVKFLLMTRVIEKACEGSRIRTPGGHKARPPPRCDRCPINTAVVIRAPFDQVYQRTTAVVSTAIGQPASLCRPLIKLDNIPRPSICIRQVTELLEQDCGSLKKDTRDSSLGGGVIVLELVLERWKYFAEPVVRQL